MKCSYPKSAHILCMLCASKHSSKPAYTVLATYMNPPTQAGAYSASCLPNQPCAYSASCVHASTHSSLCILCKPCTFRPRMQACMQVCMRALHAKFACTCRDVHALSEHACIQRMLCTCRLHVKPAGLHALSSCRACRFACAYMHAKNNALLYCSVVWSLVDRRPRQR